MFKTLIATTFVCAAFALPLQADEEKPQPPRRDKRDLTEEQRTLMKDLRAKYDANKDGKLDATERKAMSTEDKEKLSKALAPRKKREQQ